MRLPTTRPRKKADIAEHPKVFEDVGLLANWPPETGRDALYTVFRFTADPENAYQFFTSQLCVQLRGRPGNHHNVLGCRATRE